MERNEPCEPKVQDFISIQIVAFRRHSPIKVIPRKSASQERDESVTNRDTYARPAYLSVTHTGLEAEERRRGVDYRAEQDRLAALPQEEQDRVFWAKFGMTGPPPRERGRLL